MGPDKPRIPGDRWSRYVRSGSGLGKQGIRDPVSIVVHALIQPDVGR